MRVENPVATAPGTVPCIAPAYSTASGSELVFNHGCSGLDSFAAANRGVHIYLQRSQSNILVGYPYA